MSFEGKVKMGVEGLAHLKRNYLSCTPEYSFLPTHPSLQLYTHLAISVRHSSNHAETAAPFRLKSAPCLCFI